MTMVLKVWARPLIVPPGPNTGGVKSSQMNLFIWLVLQLNRLPDPVMVKALSIFLIYGPCDSKDTFLLIANVHVHSEK